MIITYIRSSSFQAHEMCPMRYFIEYNLGWQQPSNKKAEKGTIVHKVLEILGRIKIMEQNGDKQFIDDIVGRVRLSNYNLDSIIDKVYQYYVKHSPNQWNDADDLKECRKWVNKAISYKEGTFDPRNNNIQDVEKAFDIEILQPWAIYNYDNGISGCLSLKGTIDQIVRVDDDTLEIVDWKTGARKDWAKDIEKTYSVLKNDFQLRLYHYCVKKLYPDINNVLVTIFYINDGGPFTICFTDDDIVQTEQMIKNKFEEIKQTQSPKLNKSWKCKKFCHYGMSTFENSSVLPIIEKRVEQVTPRGKCMTKCEQVKYCMEHRGMKSVIENMSSPGHNVDYYHAPGDIKGDSNEQSD